MEVVFNHNYHLIRNLHTSSINEFGSKSKQEELRYNNSVTPQSPYPCQMVTETRFFIQLQMYRNCMSKNMAKKSLQLFQSPLDLCTGNYRTERSTIGPRPSCNCLVPRSFVRRLWCSKSGTALPRKTSIWASLIAELIGSLKLGNVWVFVQLIFCPH